MRAHHIRLFAVLALLVALDPASLTAGPPSSPPPTFLSLAFDQVDWMYGENDPAKRNSLWGQMSFAYKAARKTWYLNGAVKLPGSQRQSWFLRNLPLDGERNPTLRRRAVFLDLRSLGLKDGMDWSKVQYELTLDTSIRKKAPQAVRGPITTVGTRERDVAQCFGSGPVGRFDPGLPPRPILISVPPKETGPPRVVRPLQERESRHCVAGAFARSLEWLNQIHKFEKDLTVEEIYDDLLEEGVSEDPDANGNGTALDEWILAKAIYARFISGGRIKTKVWDSGNALPTIQGVPKEEGDFVNWAWGEMDKGADVEVAVFNVSGSTVMSRSFYMLTDHYTSNGRHFVRFRADENPGNAAEGDDFEFEAEIYLGPDGIYRFDSDSHRIVFAVSESIS